ncbi:hypothetical protein LTR86_009401 [Recurvomyces mirabilis]|nr:hypothetical protein LTR86_009401 [Recurvomyces mirabilis]
MLTCPVCDEEPENPHTFSCSHVYCLECLQDLRRIAARRDQGRARCLLCGTLFIVAKLYTSKKRSESKSEAAMAKASPSLKKMRIDFLNTVTVLVGETKKAFQIPEGLLCQRSDFFKVACNERWQKEVQGPLALPEDDPQTFSTYLQILYQDQVVAADNEADWFKEMSTNYVLADKLCDTFATNLIMDSIVGYLHGSECEAAPSPTTVSLIYSSTATGSPLRGLLVQYCATRARFASCFVNLKNPNTPRAFVEDVALALMKSDLSRPQQASDFVSKANSEWHVQEKKVD